MLSSEMQWRIDTLYSTNLSELTSVFNKAFEDYIMPIQLSESGLLHKIQAEDIVLDHSVGAFDGPHLIGFVLFGIRRIQGLSISYNAGTGVLPGYRGHHLTEKMYNVALDRLKSMQVYHHQLEVICENEKALSIYKKIGYQIRRSFACFKGSLSLAPAIHTVKIEEEAVMDDHEISTTWNFAPCWQNSLSSVNNLKEKQVFLNAYLNHERVGYLIYTPEEARIKQFGVKKEFRNLGIGRQLFNSIHRFSGKKCISILNVDESDTDTCDFLKGLKFEIYTRQYEMSLSYE